MNILNIILALLIYDIVKAIISLAIDGAKKDVKPTKKSFQDRLEEKAKEHKKQK